MFGGRMTKDKTPIYYENDSSSSLFHSAVDGEGIMKGGFLFPCEGGCIYNGISYSEHALERMAPCTPEIIDILLTRAFKRMKKLTVDECRSTRFIDPETGIYEIEYWWEEFYPKPRGILPHIVEDLILYGHGFHEYEVKIGSDGCIVTVYRRYTNPNDQSDEVDRLLDEAKEKIMTYARRIKTRTKEKTAAAVEGNQKLIREERSGHIMNRVRKQTPGLDVKLKVWEKEMAKTKAKNSHKKIADMAAAKAAAKVTNANIKAELEDDKLLAKMNASYDKKLRKAARDAKTASSSVQTPPHTNGDADNDVSPRDHYAEGDERFQELVTRDSNKRTATEAENGEENESDDGIPQNWEDFLA